MATQKQMLDAAIEEWKSLSRRPRPAAKDYIPARRATEAWIDQVANAAPNGVSQDRIDAVKRVTWTLLRTEVSAYARLERVAVDLKALLRD